MALKGTLQSFPPSEPLQFLTYSGKTGTLLIDDDLDSKLFAFENGQLYYAIHQRQLPDLGQLPDLTEIVVHRAWVSREDMPTAQKSRFEWDDVVSRALARRRNLAHDGLPDRRNQSLRSGPIVSRLGSVLVAQNTITSDQLANAMKPASMPDVLLESVLRGADPASAKAIQEARSSKRENQSLYECLIEQQLLAEEEMAAAASCMTDESLAEHLVYLGVVNRPDVRYCLEQFEALGSRIVPGVKLGRLLVAKGTILARQLEKAREEQVKDGRLIGEVLMEQGVLTREQLSQAISEQAALAAAFGPLSSLRRRLESWHGITTTEFDDALRSFCDDPDEHADRTLIDSFAEVREIPWDEVRALVRDILMEEVCDLLTLERASFEFFEGFSLQDVLGTELPRIHSLSFDAQSLLLSAHSEIDELRRTNFKGISARTVFVVETMQGDAPEQFSAGDEHAAGELNVIMRCDGRHSLREVCRVLPGSPFSHIRMCAEFHEKGMLRPLGREEAFEAGNDLVAQGQHRRASVLFTHAVGMPGGVPSDEELRVALQNARWRGEERLLQRIGIGLIKLSRAVVQLPVIRNISRFFVRSSMLASVRKGVMGAAMGLRSIASRCRVAFEQFLIRRGWARYWWGIKKRIVTPIGKLFGRRGDRKVVTLGVLVTVLFVLLLQATPEQPPEPIAPITDSMPASVAHATPLATFRSEAPIETSPVHHDGLAYFTARDGMLRAMRLQEPVADANPQPGAAAQQVAWSLEEEWAVQGGEYGDILSSPMIAGERILVTNLRGEVLCVSLAGEVMWKAQFPRLERIAPSPIYDEDANLAGIAVVSYESVHVLDPENGQSVYQLRTGNRITTAPAGAGSRLFVGSTDNHLYGVDWRAGEILWEDDVGDDVTTLHYQEGNVVFGTRAGRFSARDAETGAQIWSRSLDQNAIRSTRELGPGSLFLELARSRGEVVWLADGETTSELSLPYTYRAAQVQRQGDRLFYVSKAGYVGEVNAAGEHLWRTEPSIGEVSGWAIGEGWVMAANRVGELVAFSLPTQTNGGER